MKTLQEVADHIKQHCPEDVSLGVDYINDGVAVFKGGKYLFLISRRDINDSSGSDGYFLHLLTERLKQK